MTELPKRLYHYTCSHSIGSIAAMKGKLMPNPGGGQPITSAYARELGFDREIQAMPVVWLTDIDVRSQDDVRAIGLVGAYTPCDRVEFRLRVAKAPHIQWWADWADGNDLVDDEWRKLIEYGCKPEHWWVSPEPLPGCRIDERYQRP